MEQGDSKDINTQKNERNTNSCGYSCLAIILVATFLLLSGCSNDDSSEQAQDTIIKNLRYTDTAEEKAQRELKERERQELERAKEEKRLAEQREKDLKARNEKARAAEIEQKRITPEKYNSISMGMTLDDVVKVMGFRGSEVSSGAIAGNSISIYMFYGSNDVTVSVSFVNGCVSSKSQSGL